MDNTWRTVLYSVVSTSNWSVGIAPGRFVADVRLSRPLDVPTELNIEKASCRSEVEMKEVSTTMVGGYSSQ